MADLGFRSEVTATHHAPAGPSRRRPRRAIGSTRAPLTVLAAVAVPMLTAAVWAPPAAADNRRFNSSVVADVYQIQHTAGCTNDVHVNPQLLQAAQWHTLDVLHNRNLDGDIGSDGTSPQDRANAAGYHGTVAETVAINPALAISGIELLNQWYYNPAYLAIMKDCANSEIGVWSENSLDRTVVVAVYGKPQPA